MLRFTRPVVDAAVEAATKATAGTAAPLIRSLGAVAANLLGMQPDAVQRLSGQRGLMAKVDAQASEHNPVMAANFGKGQEAAQVQRPAAQTSYGIS
jgi:hypothetical protein